ncbi:V-set and transmembrane domain-containing protein 2B isoform 1-T4 [Polymixia lowei]
MPCAFKAVGPAPTSLEIQWWYLKEAVPKELAYELQISAPANRAKIGPKEATKISTVRVQGNAISHRLSLSKVKKEEEGVYECRVSDLWADDVQDFTVRAVLRVKPLDGTVAEEAASHIQNRWLLRNSNAALGGGGAARATSEPGQRQGLGQGSLGGGGGQRGGQGKPRGPQRAGPGLLPSATSTASSVAKSSASPPPGNAAILRQQHRAGCGVMSTMDPLLFISLLFLHQLVPFLLAH